MDCRVNGKTHVFIAAPNRLLRETLARMLRKHPSLDITGCSSLFPVPGDEIAASRAEILLMASGGASGLDPEFIRLVKEAAGEVKIILLGMEEDEKSFLQSVRAGVVGYLSSDASAQEVIAGGLAAREGGAVCSGRLCRALFDYVARDTVAFPSASMQRSLGLTRREQQLVPLVAQGLTNKEIANRFCLSEQTIKNHLYRMMQKVGVSDRLSVVELCRTQGFVV
jgi:DNA-binding NarL/FixJ family response regulator